MTAASEPDTPPAKRNGLLGPFTAATLVAVIVIAALAAVPTMAMLALAVVTVVALSSTVTALVLRALGDQDERATREPQPRSATSVDARRSVVLSTRHGRLAG
jgi:uncharacterized membrane protein YdfJ with MMPL/SSD domain